MQRLWNEITTRRWFGLVRFQQPYTNTYLQTGVIPTAVLYNVTRLMMTVQITIVINLLWTFDLKTATEP
jgi:hypothetical protein